MAALRGIKKNKKNNVIRVELDHLTKLSGSAHAIFVRATYKVLKETGLKLHAGVLSFFLKSPQIFGRDFFFGFHICCTFDRCSSLGLKTANII